MWSRFKKEAPPENYPSVIEGLKKIYKTKLRPLEELYRFGDFHEPLLRDSDFDAKPSVLFLGQYSTGKTSFIRYLLDGNYPGANIGPEPTTDRFVAIMGGKDEMIIPGNALVVQNDMPFLALSRFGNDFLNKFQASVAKRSVLEDLVLIDTPGVLSGEKQRIGRSYDFPGVIEWFAQRADMIVLVFDAHKLDISDEFKTAIEALKGQEDKVRVVLNKSDGVTSQQLLRVYGALMWSLGKVIATPEVMRVYVGSFWEKPYKNLEFAKLFDAERDDLLKDLRALPRQATVRKVNELVKRVRLAKVHAYLLSYLRNEMPVIFGKQAKQDELISKLNEVYNIVMRRYNISVGDFPNLRKFREKLKLYDFTKFPKLNLALIEQADRALSDEIPKLIKMFPLEQQAAVDPENSNPFEESSPQERRMNALGITEEHARDYVDIFNNLNLVDGHASGTEVRPVMMQSGLPKEVLGRIWSMCDRARHGYLNEEEFVLAMGLITLVRSGKPLPEKLPDTLSSVIGASGIVDNGNGNGNSNDDNDNVDMEYNANVGDHNGNNGNYNANPANYNANPVNYNANPVNYNGNNGNYGYGSNDNDNNNGGGDNEDGGIVVVGGVDDGGLGGVVENDDSQDYPTPAPPYQYQLYPAQASNDSELGGGGGDNSRNQNDVNDIVIGGDPNDANDVDMMDNNNGGGSSSLVWCVPDDAGYTDPF